MTYPLQSRATRLLRFAKRSAGRLAFGAVAFLCAPPLAMAQSALPVFVADFNHDGIPDVLILPDSTASNANLRPATATIAFGSVPYATFTTSKGITFPSGCAYFRSDSLVTGLLSVGDFNGDNIPDIFFTCFTDTSRTTSISGVMIGNGDGTFGAAKLLALPSTLHPLFIVLSDLNHDGTLDVAAASADYSKNPAPFVLSSFEGKGDGTFLGSISTTLAASYNVGGSVVLPIQSIIAVDVNGDGYPDLVAAAIPNGVLEGPNDVVVFGNNTDGTFGVASQGTSEPNLTSALGAYPSVASFTVHSGNVYGSGKPDILAPDGGTAAPGFFLLRNTSTAATYSFAAPVKTPVVDAEDLTVGNFTGTAFSDVALFTSGGLTVLANDGSGKYIPDYSGLGVSDSSLYSGVIAVADANFDGYSDIYTASTNATTGGIDLNVSLVSGSATATAAPITLGIGTKDVSAVWPGNVNFAASTATGSQTVQGVPVGVTVLSSKNPANLGDPVTFTISVAPLTASSVIPTGALVLQSDGITIASGSLGPTGTFSFATSALTQGSHAITATYAGDNFFTGAVSTVLTQVVNHLVAVAPTLTWYPPTPITYGTPLGSAQLDAVATDATGATVPGTFQYSPDFGTILPGGPHTLSVTFNPTDTASFLSATQTVILNVLPAPSATTLNVSASDSAVTSVPTGTVITLTAAVNAAGMGVSPGQVNFCDASAPACTDIHILGTAQLTQYGIATLNFTPGPGTHTYKAFFLGTHNVSPSFATASSPLTVTAAIPTTTTLAQTGTPGNYTLTATTTATGPIAPTGSTSFLDITNSNFALGSVRIANKTSLLSYLNAIIPPTATTQIGAVAVGDFNGDGKLDFVATSLSNTVFVYLGNGDGTFTAGPQLTTPTGPDAIAVGDFNGDGKADLVVSQVESGGLSIFLGAGDGTFTAGASIAVPGGASFFLVVADLNQDGIPDLIVPSASQPSMTSNTLPIFLGNGDGTFRPAPSSSVPFLPLGVAMGDFNGDGLVDLALATINPNQVLILLGNGDGTFNLGVTLPAPATNSIVSSDVNGDGFPDLLITGFDTNTVSVLLGNGDGTFRAGTTVSTGAQPIFSALGDFNGDGKVDVAVGNNGDDTITMLLGNGDGTFISSLVTTPSGSPPEQLVAGDFNGDGLTDLAGPTKNYTLAAVLLTQLTQIATDTATGVSPLTPGTHQVIAAYPGDTTYTASQSTAIPLIGLQNLPTITFTPVTPTIPYGTPLGPQQLDATALGITGAPIDGVFTYTPAAGTILHAGTQTLSVTFTPTSTIYIPSTATTTITVTPIVSTLAWPTPATIAYGVPLNATQLDATATGLAGASLPGTFTYTPVAGIILKPGIQTLSVAYTPTDATDYLPATASVQLTVTGLAPTSITPATIPVGAGATTITISGAGFGSTAIVQVNGTPVPTTLISPTTLTAVLPAGDFLQTGTLQIVVTDPSINQTSAALTLTVIPASPTATLTGPTTTSPGTQPTISFVLQDPYPIDLTGTLDLSFAAAVTPAVDDPAVQFATGGRTLTFNIPAGSTTVPTIQLQAGTVAGTITVPLILTANGANVTPTSIQPVIIVVPAAAPTVSSATLTRSGDQLTVVIHGFSNTRQVTQAAFHFAPIAGAEIDTPDVKVPVDPIFSAWYTSTPSGQYGSTFTYTQAFTVAGGSATIASIQVTLTNSVGDSTTQTVQ